MARITKVGRITKAEIKRRREAEDAKNRVFFLWEAIQRAELGGHPCPNDANLMHGEPVYVVKKRDLMEFALGVQQVLREHVALTKIPFAGCLEAAISEIGAICERILAEDQFVMPLRQLGTPKKDE